MARATRSIAGDSGVGKSSLLRTVGLSLALGNRQPALQLVLIDGAAMLPRRDPGLRPLEYLPHALGQALEDPEDAVEALTFLAEEVSYRRAQRIRRPCLVVLIDEVVGLLSVAETGVLPPLVALLQQGAEAGIHVIMSTESPGDAALHPLLRTAVPLRLVGSCANVADTQAAAGRALADVSPVAESGAFVAVGHATQTSFQAAYVDAYDFGLALDYLQRDRRGTLLAAPIAGDWSAALEDETPG